MSLNQIIEKNFDEGQLFYAADVCEATGAFQRAYELRQVAISYREKKDPKGANDLRRQLKSGFYLALE